METTESIQEPKPIGRFTVLKDIDVPCNKCGDNVHVEEIIDGYQNATVCKKCHHAFTCFALLHESRKAVFQKKDKAKGAAETQGKICADCFKSRYGIFWQEHLNKVWPEYEFRLQNEWGQTIEVWGIIRRAKSKGYLKSETEAAW